MKNLYNLPSLLRIFFFAIFSLILVALIIIVVYRILRKSKDYLKISYFLSFYIGILLLCITRTPLNYEISEFTFYFLNSLLLLPALVSFSLFLKERKFLNFIDFIAFVLCLPLFMFFDFYKYIYILIVGYFVIRCILIIIDEYENMKNDPGTYLIKAGLDTLNCGIVFANKNGQIIFINTAMKNYFSLLNISEYSKIQDIVNQLISSIHYKRSLSSTSFIIEINDYALNFQYIDGENHHQLYQLVCYDVSEEEMVIATLENTQNELDKTQSELRQTIADIEMVEKEKEVLKLKGNLHDIMSQRLSILHCYIIEIKGEDIRQIKELISTMLLDMYDERKLDSKNRLKQLIHSFAIIDVKLSIEGELPIEKEKADLFFKIIRECTTNAIRHGKATKVFVTIKEKDNHYFLKITNNGHCSLNIMEGNGIKNIRYQIEKINGKLEIVNYPEFIINICI